MFGKLRFALCTARTIWHVEGDPPDLAQWPIISGRSVEVFDSTAVWLTDMRQDTRITFEAKHSFLERTPSQRSTRDIITSRLGLMGLLVHFPYIALSLEQRHLGIQNVLRWFEKAFLPIVATVFARPEKLSSLFILFQRRCFDGHTDDRYSRAVC